MLEEESDAIGQLGNWNSSMQDSCYSTKLPMRPIWKLAGFVHTNGMHYNPCTQVEVPKELARLTPIGQWVINAFSNVKSAISDLGLVGPPKKPDPLPNPFCGKCKKCLP
jgi:hypothetical protein